MVELIIDLSKRYDQVTWAMAHDSHTCKPADKYDDRTYVPQGVDQTQPVSAQLKGGIRAVRISTGIYRLERGTIILQHGDPDGVGKSFGSLKDYLTQVRDFLVSNTKAIVTIIDEGDVPSANMLVTDGFFNGHDHYCETVAKVYDDVFNGSGIKFFEPEGKVEDLKDGKNWPTLQSMINKNQRLVVFTSGIRGKKWMLPSYYQVREGQSGINLIAKNDGVDDDSFASTGYSMHRPVMPITIYGGSPLPAPSPLAILNHYVYDWDYHDHMLINVKESSQDYSKWVVGDLLIESTLRFWAVNKQRPNFLNVDFYQGVWGHMSYLIQLVNTMNSVETVGDLFEKTKGCVIQDTRNIGAKGGLKIGNTYRISSKDNPSANVVMAYDNSDHTVKMRPKNDNDPNQQWQFFYNTPGPGITLVNVGSKKQIVTGTPFTLNDFTALNSKNDNTTAFEVRDDIIRRSTDDDYHFDVYGGNAADRKVGIHKWCGPREKNQLFDYELVKDVPTYPAALFLVPAHSSKDDKNKFTGSDPYTFLKKENIKFSYYGGKLVLSSTPDGTGQVWTDDKIILTIQPEPYGNPKVISFDYAKDQKIIVAAPHDVTEHFPSSGTYWLSVELVDTIHPDYGCSDYYLVHV